MEQTTTASGVGNYMYVCPGSYRPYPTVPCPSCGYCPTCGRGWANPTWIYPYAVCDTANDVTLTGGADDHTSCVCQT